MNARAHVAPPEGDRLIDRALPLSERVAGVDEVGRGPLAGPVVAAAVLFERDTKLAELGLTDSKRLTPTRRAELDLHIRAVALAVSVAVVDVTTIDELNILRASHLAMAKSIAGLSPSPSRALVDGPFHVPFIGVPHDAVVDGDVHVSSISAASIVAKVYRDLLMEAYDRRYPGYGFGAHKGYATRAHLAALGNLGPSPIHRRSFAPVSRQLGVRSA